MIVAVLQARVSSRRLPGKVLLPILGRPMLSLQIERVLRSRRIDKLVLATSDQPEDDGMVDIARDMGIDLFRGSLEDVLDRFYGAAAAVNPDWVVRLTGDCPLADAGVIDQVIDAAVAGGFDYATNAVHPTWPDGLDCEVMTFAVLERCWREARTPVEREHVTPYINTNPEKFQLFHVKGETDLSGLRWTVDEPADFAFVTRVYEALYPSKPDFTSTDVLAFLADNPEVLAVNSNIERNEGYRLSLEKLRNNVGRV